MKKKNKKLKPLLQSKRIGFYKWLASLLPCDYQDMHYLEPFSSDLCSILFKEKSNIEALNFTESDILNLYKSLRNEPKEFIKQLKKYRYSKNTFLKLIEQENQDDYLDSSVKEYVLRKMSVSENKKNFKKGPSNWSNSNSTLIDFSNRINDIFIFNDCPFELLQSFNFDNSLVFCNPPDLNETTKGKKVYTSELSLDKHKYLSSILDNFKGKVIVKGVISPLYKRIYKSWNMHKSNYVNKYGKIEVVWLNY